MEELNKNKKLQVISIVIMVCSILIIAFGVYLRNNDEKESKKDNEKYTPNKVLVNDFSLSFLKLESDKKNLIYSPLSIKYALSMLKEGANGKTKEEIVSVIGEDEPTKYEAIPNTLSLANSVFIRDTYKDKVNNSYTDTIKSKYDAEVIYDSFKDATTVNDWIANKTFNLIKNMLKDEYFNDPNLELILVNALAIDMEWQEGFDKESTTSRPFIKENGEEVGAAMMNTLTKNSKYYQDSDFNVVSIPLKEYNGKKLEFVAVMPRKDNLQGFVTSDNFEEQLNELLNKMHNVDKEKLSISIPRFDFEYDLKLSEDLKTLGIVSAFNPDDADFSNISNTGLYVEDALHRANIKFSEEGIKASAATVILMRDEAAIEEDEVKYLTYDRPFLFLIKDSDTNEIWFTGTVYNPLLWEDVKTDYKYE